MGDELLRDKDRAIHKFWSSFGLKAYEANSVPDDAITKNGGKYLTYELSTSAFMDTLVLSASLWYKSSGWTEIVAKSQEISTAIGIGGTFRRVKGGYLWIRRATPFAQRMSDEDDTVRRIYILVEVEFLTKD